MGQICDEPFDVTYTKLIYYLNSITAQDYR